MSDRDLRSWRQTYAALQSRGDAGCPDDERLADLLLADALAAHERTALADHVVTCARCSESLELMSALHSRAQQIPAAHEQAPRWPWAAIAAGLVLVAVAAGVLLQQRAPDVTRAPQTRAVDGLSVSSPSSGAALARDSFRLTWSVDGAEAGVDVRTLRYDVVVSSESLDVLHDRRGLETAEHTVPAAAFEGLAPGTTVLWKVDARAPDGRVVATRTFTSSVQ